MRTILTRAVLSVLGGVACALVASIPPPPPARGFRAHVICSDLVGAAGEMPCARVKLERLDRCGIRPDIPGERVVFLREGEVVASSYTDGSGWASAELDLGPGLHEISVATDSLRYDVRHERFRALVLREGEKLLVLTFDDADAARLLRPHGPVASVGRGGDVIVRREEAMRLGERVIAFVREESESPVWRASGARVIVWKNHDPSEIQGILGSLTGQ